MPQSLANFSSDVAAAMVAILAVLGGIATLAARFRSKGPSDQEKAARLIADAIIRAGQMQREAIRDSGDLQADVMKDGLMQVQNEVRRHGENRR